MSNIETNSNLMDGLAEIETELKRRAQVNNFNPQDEAVQLSWELAKKRREQSGWLKAPAFWAMVAGFLLALATIALVVMLYLWPDIKDLQEKIEAMETNVGQLNGKIPQIEGRISQIEFTKPKLDVSIEVNPDNNFKSDEPILFSIKVTNQSNVSTDYVTLFSRLPIHTILDPDHTSPTYKATNSLVTWDIGSIPPLVSMERTLAVRISGELSEDTTSIASPEHWVQYDKGLQIRKQDGLINLYR